MRLIVHVWLDVENTILGVSRQDFMRDVRSPQWSMKRMEIFRDYTLRSLMNQTMEDFEIFLFLNPRFRAVHNLFNFPDKVKRIYDSGKKMYSDLIEDDYVIVFRTDSDDLLRRDMMEDVVMGAEFREARTCRVWKDVIQWNLHHRFISDFKLPRSPFTAHVFPRSVYSNWERMSVEQFMDYKSCPNRPEERKVCIVRHGDNVTFPRIGKNMRSRKYYNEEMRKRNKVVKDKLKMIKILDRFGIPEEMVV